MAGINLMPAATLAWIGTFALLFFIIGIAIYVYAAWALMNIAKKANHKYPWLAWIPIANIVLMLQMADLHWAWILLLIGFIIPLLNFLVMIAFAVIMVMAWWKIAEKIGKPGWWGLIVILAGIIPILGHIVSLVFLGMMAWGK